MERTEYSRNEYAVETIAAHYGRQPKAYVRSFGCQQSVNDGEKLMGILLDIGMELAKDAQDADIILFNTCAVREHAEQRVFGNLGALKAQKLQNPALIIGLCGCMAQEKGTIDKIKKSYPYVDFILGVNEADRLPDILSQKFTTRKKIIHLPPQRKEVVEDIPIHRESSVKAFLPIMYGCDNFCSFCIVPHVRGRERSRKSRDILQEFEKLVQKGYREITLLGQNVNSYGKGTGENVDFSDLLEMLCKTPGEYKIRFMTSHPKDATRKMIDTIAANHNLCKHLHLPIQSGSDGLLAKMNRRYTVESYLSLINYAKQTCPEMTFSSDIMVGFPGETEDDILQTLALIKQVGFTQLFTFIYSKRAGTPAAEMPDEVSREEKTRRITRVIEAQESIIKEVVQQWIGKRFEVLVEGPGREEGTIAGRMDNNMMVEFVGDDNLVGRFVTVNITSAKGAVLLAEQI
ncbi:MAG: tRNA (N6-isopentenyl adenosine(37)-C2)-methylthiotransferase MiaB [Oscillospiraceae bacterium]